MGWAPRISWPLLFGGGSCGGAQAHLVEGVIDQVDSTVQVSWVQPRVLSVAQVAALRTRLDSWLDRVHSTLLAVEAETPELLAS